MSPLPPADLRVGLISTPWSRSSFCCLALAAHSVLQHVEPPVGVTGPVEKARRWWSAALRLDVTQATSAVFFFFFFCDSMPVGINTMLQVYVNSRFANKRKEGAAVFLHVLSPLRCFLPFYHLLHQQIDAALHSDAISLLTRRIHCLCDNKERNG